MTVFHHTPLGWMEIRTGPGEIKALWFSDEPEEVESEASSNALSDWCIRELDEYFAGTRRTSNNGRPKNIPANKPTLVPLPSR